MTAKSLISISLAALGMCLLSGCSALKPTASPESAQRVLAKAKSFQVQKPLQLSKSGEYRVALAPGQWVATLSRSKEDLNDVTLQVTKVVRVQGDTVTLETESHSALSNGDRSVIQQRVRNLPIRPRTAFSSHEAEQVLSDIEVESVKMMNPDGTIVTMPQFAVSMGRLGADLFGTNIGMGTISSGPCQTAYIKAPSCQIVPYEAKVLWITEKGTTYAHSQIPILGFVSSDSSSHSVEVIGFGKSGARFVMN